MFMATAYCTVGQTAAGTPVRERIVAADPDVLPLGTVIRVRGLKPPHNGVYKVMDTGRKIQGREIDLFLRDCAQAERFGRQSARVSVVRRSTTPRQ